MSGLGCLGRHSTLRERRRLSYLFFVLSGFVLTYRTIGAQSSVGIGLAVLKRWPRLAGPIVIVSLASGLLVWAGMYTNQPAGDISRSPWLKWWFTSIPTPPQPPLAAMEEALLGTFLEGRVYFNSSLWTMYYEFFGSFLSLGLALIVIELRRTEIVHPAERWSVYPTLYQARLFAPFRRGSHCGPDIFSTWFHKIRLRLGPALLLSIAAFVLFGFKEGSKERLLASMQS